MKRKIKLTVDALMTVLLLLLTAYQATGDRLHEWFGVGMTALLIVHHILNRRFYESVFKGKYNAYRAVSLALNALLLVCIVLTAVCGMSMSAHAVPFLNGLLDVSFARRAHLALSYWSFTLMGLHLGMHLPAMTAKLSPGKPAGKVLFVLFAAAAAAGLWLFVKNGIPGYLFLRSQFAFFDYDKPLAVVLLENLAELLFCAFIGACAARLTKTKRKTGNEK